MTLDIEAFHRRAEHEPVADYVARVRALLPEWPTELIAEWLHRHHASLREYWDLGFDRFRFAEEAWPTHRIPDTDAMIGRPEDYEHLVERAPSTIDWVAEYIRANGTWSTPMYPSGEGRREGAGFSLRS